MRIDTKYDVGDKVWVFVEDRKRCVTVNDISTNAIRIPSNNVKCEDEEIHTSLVVNYGFEETDEKKNEEFVFPTKEELVGYLIR